MKHRLLHLYLAALTLLLTAPAALAGSTSGGATFAWDNLLTRLRDNFVTTIAGAGAVIFLVGALLAHRGGDGEATVKRFIGVIVFGGIALGGQVIIDDVASSFGAILP